MTTVYFNKRFVEESEAKVSVGDGGWLHGAGLFETMRAEHGCVFRLESHLERLHRSASLLLIPLEQGNLPSPAVVAELLKRNELRNARLRLTVSAGAVQADPPTESPKLTTCLTARKLSSYPPDFYKEGISVVICKFRISPTDPIAGHKTTGYLPRLLGLREAQHARCVEALWFTTENRLSEGSISNVFVVHKGALKTPPLDTPVLPGIARGVILDIARKEGIEAEECPLTIDDLLDADEVFLTNTLMQVMPVIRIEKHGIGEGRVGPTSTKLLEEYRKLVRLECNHE